MSFELVKGNLFDQDTESLCHGVNICGKMHAGIANQFRIRYPEMFREYAKACNMKLFLPGDVFVYIDPTTRKHIFNLFSQNYPGPFAKEEWLRVSLIDTIKICEQNEVKSLAAPLVGGGIGGLDPDRVLEIFKELGNSTKVRVVVCVL